jgi:hypothetical protein
MAITPILEQVRTLKRACNLKNSQSESERLAIGATHSLSSNLIPSLLSHFKKAHPQTMIDFRISDATGIERLLLKGNVFSVSESAARALVCKKRAARLNAFEFASSHRAGSLRVVA